VAQIKRYLEKTVESLFLSSAVAAVLIVLIIFIFIFLEGLPVVQKYGLIHFIAGRSWDPGNFQFGLLPIITGSACVTVGSLIFGVPLGLGCAIFLAEMAPAKLTMIVRPVIGLLAGIPSVVYGFYGLVVLVPMIRDLSGGRGFSVLAGSMVLAVMILPTIINISENSIRSVPRELREGSLALGATHWQTIKKVILPAAGPGIMTAVALGVGRAAGETMAVILVTGNVAAVPQSILDPVRTLTANIAIDMGYSSGDHSRALFAAGIALLLIIVALNTLVALAPKKAGERF